MTMSRKVLVALGVLGTAMLGGASAASAADSGYLTANLNLRAGPGFDYPVVATMSAGSGVTIYGCLSGWSWCDIDWQGNRGWAAGSYLQVMYHNYRRPITTYGVDLGLPFVTFSFDSYWNDHYRSRGFYQQRSHFDHMPPPKGQQGGPPPSNGNPPGNNNPPHHYKPTNNNNNNFGNNPGNNNPPPPPKNDHKFNPQGPQGGNNPPNGGPQGNGPGKHPGCPPGQKFMNGSCQ
jgi:uncharacterized protein YraI